MIKNFITRSYLSLNIIGIKMFSMNELKNGSILKVRSNVIKKKVTSNISERKKLQIFNNKDYQ